MRKHFAWNPRLFLGTHDFLFGTHDFFLRTHDFFLGTHDFLPTTHDFLPTTHDFLPTTHDILPTTHDFLPTTHDFLPTTHDILPTTFDFLPTTHDFLPTTHDILPTTHDPRLLASPKLQLQLQLSCLISLLSGYVVIQFYTYCAVFQGLFNAVIGLNISKIPVKIRQFPYDLLFYANANYNCNFDAYNFLCYLGM